MEHKYEIVPSVKPYLHDLESNYHLGVASSRAHIIGSGLIDKSTIYCFPVSKNIYNFSVAMIIRKNFILLPEINRIIQNVIEVGLVQRWEQECKVSTRTRIKTHKLSSNEDSRTNVQVGSDISATLFLPIIIGYWMALGIFVAEIVIDIYNKRTGNSFWRLLHSIITPRKKAFSTDC